MTRRAATFIPKRPHKKSRAGCETCKKKKVKCDEKRPCCSYCEVRKISCTYPSESLKNSSSPEAPPTSTGAAQVNDGRAVSRSSSSDPSCLPSPASLSPVICTSSGPLTQIDMQLLNHYHTITWRTLTLRNDNNILAITKNVVPRLGLANSFLLYAILSITAQHSNFLRPSKQAQRIADVYRQKTIVSYNRALTNITSENYESLLTTSIFMQCLLAHPDPSEGDEKLWEWLGGYFSMQQGLPILASLQWGVTIPELSVAPIFTRELKPLPPAPDMSSVKELCYFSTDYLNSPPVSNSPSSSPSSSQSPEPQNLQNRSPYTSELTPPVSPESEAQQPLQQSPDPPRAPCGVPIPTSSSAPPSAPLTPPQSQKPQLFLPPPLLLLLETLTNPPLRYPPSDTAVPALLQALHTLPSIFLSMYHFRLSSDLYTRIVTWPTFQSTEYIALVRKKDPCALVILAWWFALAKCVPGIWWLDGLVERVVGVVCGVLEKKGGGAGVTGMGLGRGGQLAETGDGMGNGRLIDAIETARRVIGVCNEKGREEGAREFWRGWGGVEQAWEDGESVVVVDD